MASDVPYIPAKTVNRLAEPPINGQRHQHLIDLAMPLIGNGLSPQAVFIQLRGKFPADVPDFEIENVIQWVTNKSPTPSGYGSPRAVAGSGVRFPTKSRVSPIKTDLSPEAHAAWWLTNQTLGQEKLVESSPVMIPESPGESLKLLLELLYSETDNINIVCDFIKNEDKANPKGAGKTMPRPDWVQYVTDKGVPKSSAGAWIRPNPTNAEGSGAVGAITDVDIAAHRFMLLESDCLPLPQQFALFAKLKIPIAAVLSSGGKSVHAWARIDAPDAVRYKVIVARILTALAPFGIDQCNKNPSRLSRLAGAVRTIGASGDGLQRLLYLNPKAKPIDEPALVSFEESLLLPAIEEKPLKPLLREALGRYDTLAQNKGKLGVPTGILQFDLESGGFKAGTFIVIAAETGGGKSTLALNFINHAIKNDIGAALFSLEMDKDEIVDLLVSLNCRVNRNAFNTGVFTQPETERIIAGIPAITNYPLWIYDSPILTIDDVRRSVLQLKSEGKIGLVVVDYVQLVASNEFPNNREQQIAGISRALRSLAKEAKLPVIGLSQLNDEGKLRESRVLAHEAHIVFIVEDLEGQSPRMKVVKGRSIRKGTYPIRFDPLFCAITSPKQVDDSDVPYADS